MPMSPCTAHNGPYACQRMGGHDGMFHAKSIQFRKDGRTYRKTALWADDNGPVTFSIPTWIG